jgi:hypothetical protein
LSISPRSINASFSKNDRAGLFATLLLPLLPVQPMFPKLYTTGIVGIHRVPFEEILKQDLAMGFKLSVFLLEKTFKNFFLVFFHGHYPLPTFYYIFLTSPAL